MTDPRARERLQTLRTWADAILDNLPLVMEAAQEAGKASKVGVWDEDGYVMEDWRENDPRDRVWRVGSDD